MKKERYQNWGFRKDSIGNDFKSFEREISLREAEKKKIDENTEE